MTITYQAIDSAPVDRTPFVGWAKNEVPAVFSGHLIGGQRRFYILHDYEGLNNYEPTHWFALPPDPTGQ